jgi:hypothetical protein
MARKQGSGFKMKRGPMKDLGSFFSSFGKQLKRGQAERGIFSEKGKAEAKEARKPKWKREHDTRKKEERKRFEEREIDKTLKTNKNWGEVKDTSEVVDKPMSAQEKINMAYKGTDNNWEEASKRAKELYGTTLSELITQRDSPVEKKSPHKKSGFKMKSSPVKIYNKAGKRRKNYKY